MLISCVSPVQDHRFIYSVFIFPTFHVLYYPRVWALLFLFLCWLEKLLLDRLFNSIQFYLLYKNHNITTLCVSVWDLGWCHPGRYHSHQSCCNSQVHISLNLSSIPTPSCLVHEWMFLLLIRMNFRERGGMLHLWKFTMGLQLLFPLKY